MLPDPTPSNEHDESDFFVIDERRDAIVGEAFLVVQSENSWQDVFRLSEDAATTVGRSPDNRIVILEDECSRRHCAVFHQSGQWLVRDLGSSNGTTVNGTKILVDRPLSDGDAIRIGSTYLLFTIDLSRTLEPPENVRLSSEIETSVETQGQHASEGTNVVERRERSQYASARGLKGALDDSQAREGLAKLFRLATKMVSATSPKQLSEMVLDSLFVTFRFDIGGVLLFPADVVDRSDPDALRLIYFRSKDEAPYRAISKSLTLDAIHKGQAVLAQDSETGAKYPTLHEIQARSVICAPIHHDTQLLGLLHLYSMDHHNPLDAHTLEFTLAVAEQMGLSLSKLLHRESLDDELSQTKAENESLRNLIKNDGDLIGEGGATTHLRETIDRVARSDAHVLVQGDVGVGKSFIARKVHFAGRRQDSPFVILDCHARNGILLNSDTLLERITAAGDGTLLLSEVAELPFALQQALAKDLPNLKLRVIATTAHQLESAVADGLFDGELYEQLRSQTINAPTLRERSDDLLKIAESFLNAASEEIGRPNLSFSPSAVQAILAHTWPQNVSELKEVVAIAARQAQGIVIQAEELSIGQKSSSDEDIFQPATMEEIERDHIIRTLDWTGWQLPQAARMLGINRSTLERKIQRYDIRQSS